MKKSLHLLLAALLVTTVSACNDDPLFEIPCDAPTADAGVDQTVTEDGPGDGVDITLDGSGSTPAEGDAISSWKWTLEDGTVLEGAAQGAVLIVHLDVGVHNITLETTSAAGCTDTDTVTITVEAFAGGAVPEVLITFPLEGDEFGEGEEILFDGNGIDQFDVELPPEAFEWTSDVDGVLGQGVPLPIATLTAGPHTITLTGVDNDGLEGADAIDILINAALDVVSFADNIQPYFDASCNACHGAGAAGGIRLDSYTEVKDGSNGNGPLLVPFDSGNAGAILIPKLLADHNNGADDQAFVDEFLAQWIDDGAEDN